MNSTGYRGRRGGLVKPTLFFGLGLAFVVLAAAIFLFAPLAGFLATLSLCIAAVCFVYYALRWAVENGFFVGVATALLWVIRVAFFAALISFIVVECLVISHERIDAEAQSADYLIVLGCGVDGERPSLMLQSRIDTAENFLKAHPNVVAVLSGGQGPGEDITEAEAMRRALVAAGIDESRLLLEETSTDTIRNISNSLDIIGRDSGKVAILSNDFHLYRARVIARHEGVDAATVCAATPRVDLSLVYHIREYFSLVKVFFTYLLD